MNERNTEKTFSLESVDYAHFWGNDDRLLRFVRVLFPKLKLVMRGEMLKTIGSADDIAAFEAKLDAMTAYYAKCGHLDETAIMQIYESGGNIYAETNEEILVHGHNGLLIKARLPNQQRLVEAVKKNDMVFAIGPAGTGKTYTDVVRHRLVTKIIQAYDQLGEAGAYCSADEQLGRLPWKKIDDLEKENQPLPLAQ